MENYTVISEDKTGKRATMTLSGYISSYDSDQSFRAATFLDKFTSLKNRYDHIEINILNLYGGSITEGIPIYNAIVDAVAEGRVTISGKIEGLAASMGSIISMSIPKDNLEMGNMARLMNHRAKGGSFGTADEVRTASEIIQGYEDDMVEILAERTGMTTEKVKAKWMDGKDHYIKGPEAKKLGLVGKIYESNIKGSLPRNIIDPEKVYNFFHTQLATTPKSEIDMNLKEQLEQLLDLKDGDDILAAVTALKADADFKPRFEALDKQVNEANTAEATALVQKLVDADLVDADAIEPYNALFAASHEAAKKVVEKMLARKPIESRADLSAFIGEVVNGKGGTTRQASDKKDYHWYETNDPEQLLEMKTKEPEKFNQLFDEHFNTK